MADDTVISVENVSKAYRIWATPAQRLLSPLLAQLAAWLPGEIGAAFARKARAGYQDFFALTEVSFEVSRGEAVGIIGRNGAGKSTLLQIISGTTQATSGTVRVHGRVAALLELGSGFNPEFTGRENVYLNAAVLGISRTETDARFKEIAAFADIGDFIEQPVKTYSSGMMVRLAFAVQTSMNPDILIVDEALSVGDFFFQQKCFRRIAEMRATGMSLLFVSHDPTSVRNLCERALYLRQGRTAYWGESQEAIAAYYNEDNTTPPPAAIPVPVKPGPAGAAGPVDFRAIAQWWRDDAESSTPLPARLVGTGVLDINGRPAAKLKMGGEARFQVLFSATHEGDYQIAIELKNRHDQLVTSCSSYTCGLSPVHLAAGQSAIFELVLNLNLEAGPYSWQAVLAEKNSAPNRARRLESTPWLGPFVIEWDYENERAPFLGMFGPPTQARFISAPEALPHA